MIWDDKTPRCIAELSFRSPVRQVRLGREIIIALIDRKLYVYRFSDLTLVDHIEFSYVNRKGISALSSDSTADRAVLACPGSQKGSVICIFYDQTKVQNASIPSDSNRESNPGNTGGSTSDNLNDNLNSDSKSAQTLPNCREKTILITAHESQLALISLNFDGSLLATASDKGTIVRIFSTETGALLQELRRGVDRADIQCITFSCNSQWVVLSSDKGTVHVYAVGLSNLNGIGGPGGQTLTSDNHNTPLVQNQQSQAIQSQSSQQNSILSTINRRSHLASFGGIFNSYFKSEWSFAQYRVPDCRCIVSFGSEPNTVIIACASGAYFKCRFDPRTGGEMIREDFKSFKGDDWED